MNVQLLIDAVVRQTTVLIAELATSGGLRAPLAHIANQVFLDLASELERQGVSRKVSADMFGLALRGYQRRIRRLSESASWRGRTLWEAVLEYLNSNGVCSRAQVLHRFSNDDETLVRGVLHDLTESGLVFCSGVGTHAVYRAATPEELGAIEREHGHEGLDELIWLLVFRDGPMKEHRLLELLKVSPEAARKSIARLMADERLSETHQDGEVIYQSREFLIPLGAQAGWAAAVLDHYQAVMRTISRRLRNRASGKVNELTGGSTYTFIVWPGHPHEQEVTGELRRYRTWASELRARIDAYNREHGVPQRYTEVVSYAGQCTTERDKDESGETDE